MYVAPNAGAALEVVSLLRAPVPVGGDDVVFTLSAPRPGSLASEAVRIRAVAKNERTFYRMDAELKPGGVLSWPVADVLRPSGLLPDGFGVYGWIEREEEGRLFVPVQIGLEGKPSSPPADILLVVRTSVRLDDLRWRVRAPGTTTRPAWSSSPRSLMAGETFEIKLPVPAPGTGTQEVVVEIVGREKSTWYPALVVDVLQG